MEAEFWNNVNHLQDYSAWTLKTAIQIFTVVKPQISYIKISGKLQT
jgi:hypothetical protein